MSSTVTTEAIRKTVLVDFAPAEAFELFTTRVSSWWPTETHSYAHEKVTGVVFEPHVGGLLYEVTDEGTAEWARITAWEPPHRLALEWLIGKVSGTEIEVRFSPEGPGSRVELEHRGWERVPDATDEYQGYSHGWDAVLAPYIETAKSWGARGAMVVRGKDAGSADSGCYRRDGARPRGERAQPMRHRRRAVPRAGRRAGARRRLGEPARREQLLGGRELLRRPPADAGHVLGSKLLAREHRRGLEGRRAQQVVPLHLTVGRAVEERDDVRARPDPRAEVDHLEARLLAQFARERMLVRLAGLEPATRSRPDRPCREVEPDEQDPVGRVQDDRPCGLAKPHRRKSRNAWNQRSRSAHGTAALAGEVDGSTKSAVSPRRRSCGPSSARSPNAPR